MSGEYDRALEIVAENLGATVDEIMGLAHGPTMINAEKECSTTTSFISHRKPRLWEGLHLLKPPTEAVTH